MVCYMHLFPFDVRLFNSLKLLTKKCCRFVWNEAWKSSVWMTMVLQLNLLNLSRIDVMYSTNSSILSYLLFILFCFFVFVVAYECVEVYLFFLLCFFFCYSFFFSGCSKRIFSHWNNAINSKWTIDKWK